MFVGCIWVHSFCNDTAYTPPPSEDYPAFRSNHSHYCLNRHNGGVNGLFLDFSARKIGLKELWALKWNRGYYTGLAREIEDNDQWPEWLKPYPLP